MTGGGSPIHGSHSTTSSCAIVVQIGGARSGGGGNEVARNAVCAAVALEHVLQLAEHRRDARADVVTERYRPQKARAVDAELLTGPAQRESPRIRGATATADACHPFRPNLRGCCWRAPLPSGRTAPTNRRPCRSGCRCRRAQTESRTCPAAAPSRKSSPRACRES